MSLLAGWIGLSVTAAEVTHTPRGIWAAVILAGVVLMLTRGARLTLTGPWRRARSSAPSGSP